MIEEINGELIEYDFHGRENSLSAKYLKEGKIGKITGVGNSMTPILESGQSVICVPVKSETVLKKGDIVLCKVRGHYYLHKIHGIKGDNKLFLIGNNHGHMNGWTGRHQIFGLVSKIL